MTSTPSPPPMMSAGDCPNENAGIENGFVPDDKVIEEEIKGLDIFIQSHRPQLVNVPEIYWPSLYCKLSQQIFDAGNAFKILKIVSDGSKVNYHDEENDEDEDEATMDDESAYSWQVVYESSKPLQLDDPEHIYLIDHSWTYWPKNARSNLEEIACLPERMASLMDINTTDVTKDGLTEQILNKMWLIIVLEVLSGSDVSCCKTNLVEFCPVCWACQVLDLLHVYYVKFKNLDDRSPKYNQVYSFGHLQSSPSDDAMPVWYVMDEFGSKIQHSDDPSFRVIPFYHVPEQLCYSILWPLKELDVGDEVTRDYIQRELPPLERKCCLIPWQPADMTSIDFIPSGPGDSYFEEYRMGESVPDEDEVPITFAADQIVKVFIDYDTVEDHLTNPRFSIVYDPDDADVLFVKKTWSKFAGLKKLINQFPNERLLTCKDLLASVSRWSDPDFLDEQNLDHGPAWLPVTYNLNTQMPKFVSYFQHREKRNLNNLWICKPWNLARAMDTHITDQLSYIIRLRESGPKVACKYIENPVLIHFDEVGDVKFDIRYILLLSSAKPLKLYVYRIFWLRFANKPYSLDNFSDYEKHFTVMNYEGDFPLRQIHYDDFIPMFNEQYPEFGWEETEKKIFAMFRSLFISATSKPYPRCIPPSPNSRAMYAADLMLKWTKDEQGHRSMQPVLCEINFSPDCDRACLYHPRFTNDVLSCLFLDDIENRPITEI